MGFRYQLFWLELQRRMRIWRGAADVAWPSVPPGVWLNPSDADLAAYETAELALSWNRSSIRNPVEWQAVLRTKLRELLGLDQMAAPLPSEVIAGDVGPLSGSLTIQRFYIPSAQRRHVPVSVIWNTAETNLEKPVMICLQGHTSGAHISWGEARLPMDLKRIRNGSDYAIQAVRTGHVAICVEQIAFGERREQALTHRWDHPCVDACNRAFLLGRTLLGERVRDVMRVVDSLPALPGVCPAFNPRKIRIMGNSAGGETALFSTAMDPRIEAAIVSGCVGAWRKTSGIRRTCPDTVIPGVLSFMEYSDILALCAPRPLLVVSGVNDPIYPFDLANECANEARRVYVALNAADRLLAVSGPDGHRFYPEIAWPAFADLLESTAL